METATATPLGTRSPCPRPSRVAGQRALVLARGEGRNVRSRCRSPALAADDGELARRPQYKSGRGKRGSVFPHDKIVVDLTRYSLGWLSGDSGVERDHVFLTGDRGVKQVGGRLVAPRLAEDDVVSQGNSESGQSDRATVQGGTGRAVKEEGAVHGTRGVLNVDQLMCECCGR